MSRDKACGSANDLGVYEGVLGSRYSHAPVTSQINPCFVPDDAYLAQKSATWSTVARTHASESRSSKLQG